MGVVSNESSGAPYTGCGNSYSKLFSRFIDNKDVTLHTYDGCANSYLILSVKGMRLMAVVTVDDEVSADPYNVLKVTYQEKAYADDKIPPGFTKRESTTNKEILIGRIIDRSLRPLIASNCCVNLTVTLLRYDKSIDIKSWGVLLGSMAIAKAGVKIYGPVAAVTMSLGKCSCFIARAPFGITAVEVKSQPIKVSDLITQMASKSDCTAMWQLASEFFKFYQPPIISLEMIDFVTENVQSVNDFNYQRFYERYGSESMSFNQIASLHMSELKRADGRGHLDCRRIECSGNILSNNHGNALFTRGQTGVLAVATYSSNPRDRVTNDSVSSKYDQASFYTHYTFPGYCTNSSGRRAAISRREIGHSMLIQNALKPLYNSAYQIVRLTADVLSSDGSSSMASVCAGSLALYHKTKKHIGGISIGSFDDQLVVDLTAAEDAISNMDCKVAANEEGEITAVQMDCKSPIAPGKFCMGISKATEVITSTILPAMRRMIKS